jgi:hypothetical protein
MKHSLLSIVAAGLFVVALSTSARAETFFAYLTGAQEVPAVSTSGSGYARVFVNESTMTLSFTVVFTNLGSNQTASHIHAPAPIGANTSVAINFGAVGGTSGTITGTASITPTQLAQLRSHLGYVNVHTSGFPGGEIRGQLGKKRPIDFDGDGRQDYSVLRFPAAGDPRPITWWNLNSTAGAQTVATSFNALTDFPVPGDFDGDGRDDYAVFRANTAGTQSEYWILKSSNSTIQYYAWGLGGDLNVARDYDGDGITDPAVMRRGAVGSTAVWYIRQSTNGQARTVLFGTSGTGANNQDFPVPGDYDGDGKFDIAVYRAGTLSPTNTYIVLRSSDGTVSYTPFGNFVTDWIVPGDYDGDGKYDFAVARTGSFATSPMVWWIINSSTGTTRAQQFGISSDTPAQGDYDGDARADIAVHRRATTTGSPGFFWVYRSFDNTAQVTQWGNTPDFPVNTFDTR